MEQMFCLQQRWINAAGQQGELPENLQANEEQHQLHSCTTPSLLRQKSSKNGQNCLYPRAHQAEAPLVALSQQLNLKVQYGPDFAQELLPIIQHLSSLALQLLAHMRADNAHDSLATASRGHKLYVHP